MSKYYDAELGGFRFITVGTKAVLAEAGIKLTLTEGTSTANLKSVTIGADHAYAHAHNFTNVITCNDHPKCVKSKCYICSTWEHEEIPMTKKEKELFGNVLKNVL